MIERYEVYMSTRVKDLPIPPVTSVIDKCDSCGDDIWIHVLMLRVAKNAKSKQCSHCVQEATNLSVQEIISSNLDDTFETMQSELGRKEGQKQ